MLVRQRHMMFESMRHRSADEHRTGDSAFRKWARTEMRAGRLVFFLIMADGVKLVAGGGIWLRDTQPGPGFPGGKIPYLLSMYTEPDFRGRGFATRIVKSASTWARSRGYPWMTLHASDMGRPVYEKLGWKNTNEMEYELRDRRGPKRKPSSAALG